VCLDRNNYSGNQAVHLYVYLMSTKGLKMIITINKYIYIYICVYMYIYVNKYIFIYIYVCIYVYMSLYIYILYIKTYI